VPKKANPERGEHELALPGKTYRLRPSHAALKAIELQTGESTLALVRLGNVGGSRSSSSGSSARS
jgi:hypothetical protein